MKLIADATTWLDIAVAVAQVIAAIGTAAAVWAAIRIAKRSEEQRVRIDVVPVPTYKHHGPEFKELTQLKLRVTVTNAGPIQVDIDHIYLSVLTLRGTDQQNVSLLHYYAFRGELVRLNHNESVKFDQVIRVLEAGFWNFLPNINWRSARPKYVVTTTLGNSFDHVISRAQWKKIKRLIIELTENSPRWQEGQGYFFSGADIAVMIEGREHVIFPPTLS